MLQFQEVIASPAAGIVTSVSEVTAPRQGAVDVNIAVGGGVMVAGNIVVLWQPLSDVAVKSTVYVPEPL